MTQVRLNAEERAICRVRYRHVTTYMDPGPHPKTYNDRVCKATAAHWKNGKALEHGSEYSDLLFPFGNYRAVSRHINKRSAKTVDADREIALEWVKTRPKDVRPRILALLGLTDTDGDEEDESDLKVKIKDEVAVKRETVVGEVGKIKLEESVKLEENTVKVKHEDPDVKRETVADVGGKRKIKEEDMKDDVLSKRPRGDATPSIVKTEVKDVRLKTEE